jgi:hypothetical protein
MNGLGITWSGFEPTPKIDCARFIFVGHAIVSHGDRDQSIMQLCAKLCVPLQVSAQSSAMVGHVHHRHESVAKSNNPEANGNSVASATR